MSETKRILVVDAVSQSRELLAVWLAKSGYEVWQAESGLGAVGVTAQRQPDLIITAIEMPGMTGWELVGELMRRGSTTPVILHTPLDRAVVEEPIVRLASVRYLEMPPDPAVILAFIAEELAAAPRLFVAAHSERWGQFQGLIDDLAQFIEAKKEGSGDG